MKFNYTVIVSIFIAVSLVVLGFALVQVHQERQRLNIELEQRANLLGQALHESISGQLAQENYQKISQVVAKFNQKQRILGLAVYNVKDSLVGISSGIESYMPFAQIPLKQAMGVDSCFGHPLKSGAKNFYLHIMPIHDEGRLVGATAIFQDTDYIHKRLGEIWRANFIRLLVLALSVALVTTLVIQWSIFVPMNRMVEWMQSLREQKPSTETVMPSQDFFSPLGREVTHMAESILEAREAAEQEARLRAMGESVWTPERLKEEMRTLLDDKQLVVVSNREPYMHNRKGKGIEWIMPASGMVTAIEPILKACGGTWIASGTGDADRDVVDQDDKVRVPPDDPRYNLKRLWLSKEEEEGFYYGFSNEGLWPLCHIAHTRPIFRKEDWQYYQQVNQKFADAVLKEIEGLDEPLILIQDYHFALLPQMLKAKRPDARVAIFWHIPWPNSESFGICPWQRELLYGMQGADLIGFHTQFHCNNFLDTMARAVESQINWDNFTVRVGGHTTLVKPFPISIAFTLLDMERVPEHQPSKEELFKEHGIKAEFMGVGVDRLDYTKGLMERFLAVENFLERYPEYQGKFTFVELGAPSRTHIKRYSDLVAEVEKEVERINWRFKGKDWKPILFLKKHHSHQEIAPYYQAADLCMVTSLHDGMNLVAKEFVASRSDGEGVLILSRFTGAVREMRDALIINPYDIERTAGAIKYALEMPAEERKQRMGNMRQHLLKNNIFLWAVRLIRELSAVRV
ncbi:MAG: trehalose-6-phosphate synthase [Candidatus Edwardsbacteria bacterium]|nr:trehalose-6-phosphate synthase [Candidatus Edwardsbacteria bacterium]MBU1577696.1 trehalose-6-phosphate synthase [Candidatus Edwardsbacteria bacterium]MBU2463127.1 trehalose-6-phosphate synthase [Candidatus Edwardsbacteria bacterium]MBU2594603.1 trehalose-6-phosphate synthase [Candidatus Edwardsbacteria bacterium]